MATQDYLNEIERLGELKERGLISDDEFLQRKQHVLAISTEEVKTSQKSVEKQKPAASFAAVLEFLMQPRTVMSRVIDGQYSVLTTVLSCLLGISLSTVAVISDLVLVSSDQKTLVFDLTQMSLLVFIGSISGMLIIAYLGYCVEIAGRWLGSRASRANLRTACAWGTIPLSMLAPVAVVVAFKVYDGSILGLFGRILNPDDALNQAKEYMSILHACYVIQAVWASITTTIALAATFPMKQWKASLVLVLAVGLAYMGVLLIVGVVGAIASLS